MKLAIALLCACIVVTQAFDSGLFQSKVHHRVRSNKLHASAVEPYAADDDIGKAEIEAAFARGLNSAPSKWEPLKPSIAKKFPKGVKNAKGAFAKRLDANYDNFLQKFEKFEMEANDASVNVKLDTPLKTLAYKTLDVSPADDFMETTKPMMKKARLAARNGGIKEKRELVRMEVAYKNLNKYRFKELMFGDMEDRYGRNSARDILKEVDVKVGARDDRSKEKKISDLRRLKMDTRGGIYRYVPIQYHVYVDFFKSMYRKPKFEDVQKTTVLSLLFAGIVGFNAQKHPRASTMWYTISCLIICSQIMTRGAPTAYTPGMPRSREQEAQYSASSWVAGTQIGGLLVVGTLLPSLLLTALIPLPIPRKIRQVVGQILSLLLVGYISPNFSSYESKKAKVSRWEKAKTGQLALTDAEEAEVLNQVYADIGDAEGGSVYNFEYAPFTDDELPKTYDEHLHNTKHEEKNLKGVDEDRYHTEFEVFQDERRATKKDEVHEYNPINDAVEDEEGADKWLGERTGMFDSRAEAEKKYITDNYKTNVLNANKWRGQERIFNREDLEDEVVRVDGSWAFRDAVPRWFRNTLMGTRITDKSGLSTRAARAFGTYRRAMFKRDDTIELKSADGTTVSEKDKAKKMPPKIEEETYDI